ncbi:MAG TPA: hypothetical protein VNI01_11880, partial [Elusimicrobiota bacterium]|nr:hypothetical protein [Elusimicrobiota bacterium]
MVVRCPGCAKQIDESAWRCPHCARDFQGDNPMSRMPKHAPGSERPTGARTHSGPRTGRPHGPARGLPRAGG